MLKKGFFIGNNYVSEDTLFGGDIVDYNLNSGTLFERCCNNVENNNDCVLFQPLLYTKEQVSLMTTLENGDVLSLPTLEQVKELFEDANMTTITIYGLSIHCFDIHNIHLNIISKHHSGVLFWGQKNGEICGIHVETELVDETIQPHEVKVSDIPFMYKFKISDFPVNDPTLKMHLMRVYRYKQ